MTKPEIFKCSSREILDSRGNPTVEATVYLTDGTIGIASVPSGASTGIYEAHERRDGDSDRFFGKGVTDAVDDIQKIISPKLVGLNPCDQQEIDDLLMRLDGTKNKEKLGANAILAVSLANARAAANFYHLPLFKYIGGSFAYRLPVPMMNILNGGAHASNNVEIQEFMIVPVGFGNYPDALRAGAEVYHSLKKLLTEKGFSTSVGDEGGFAPNLENDEQALELICEAISYAGYSTDEIMIALDAAASEWYDENGDYLLPKRNIKRTRAELIDYWEDLCRDFPMIMSIEDGLDQRDSDGWKNLTERLGKRIMLVGDDLFVTNSKRFRSGIQKGIANSILIKPNQIGTLSETLDVIRVAKDSGYRFILSHRSGDTEDTGIADIAVATGAYFIKTGAPCRSERVAKYNRLLRINSALSSGQCYGFANLPKVEKNESIEI